MTQQLHPDAVRVLRERLHGRLVSPGDVDYDTVRRVWNGRIDRRPALVAFCADGADVVTAVQFARENAVLAAVRGGGHSCAGTAVYDDALVIDLSLMKSIEVDAANRSAHAQGGVLWGELDRATQAFGLAVPGGTDSEVGIAGLTLGGGNGWLMGLHGATCDNLLSANVVMADGRNVLANSVENADLFWALRGGGGNFGIVTLFHYRLHPIGPTVIGGAVMYAYQDAAKILRYFRDFTSSAPDALTVYACLIFDRGRPVVAIASCYAGSADRAVATVAPLRQWGTVVSDQLRPMSYIELQSLFDAARPAGRRCAMRSNFMAGLPDPAIEILVEKFRTAPSLLSAVIVEHCHGAIARVASDATAFALRSNPYHLEILGFWDSAERDATNLEWVERFFAAMQPFSAGEVYVNSLDEGEGHRAREAYRTNYARLAALKSKFDPTNFFRCNINIPPGICEGRAPTR
jgi:FAD/FMN-containing dehydrogenase